MLPWAYFSLTEGATPTCRAAHPKIPEIRNIRVESTVVRGFGSNGPLEHGIRIRNVIPRIPFRAEILVLFLGRGQISKKYGNLQQKRSLNIIEAASFLACFWGQN